MQGRRNRLQRSQGQGADMARIIMEQTGGDGEGRVLWEKHSVSQELDRIPREEVGRVLLNSLLNRIMPFPSLYYLGRVINNSRIDELGGYTVGAWFYVVRYLRKENNSGRHRDYTIQDAKALLDAARSLQPKRIWLRRSWLGFLSSIFAVFAVLAHPVALLPFVVAMGCWLTANLVATWQHRRAFNQTMSDAGSKLSLTPAEEAKAFAMFAEVLQNPSERPASEQTPFFNSPSPSSGSSVSSPSSLFPRRPSMELPSQTSSPGDHKISSPPPSEISCTH